MKTNLFAFLILAGVLPATASSAQAQPHKLHLVENVIDGQVADFCMDVEGNSMAAGENVQVYPCHNGDNQIWDFIPAAGGYSQVVARSSGLCLDVKGAETRAGTNIQQFGCHGGANQLWRLLPHSSGFLWLQNLNSGLCATAVTGGLLKQVGILEQQPCGSSGKHLWIPEPILCGNGVCDGTEICSTCPVDCGSCPNPPLCGDGLCESNKGENCSDCPTDCGPCPCTTGASCTSDQDCGGFLYGSCESFGPAAGTCLCML